MLTILGVYQLANAGERHYGARWYPDAFKVAQTLGEEFKLNAYTVAGVIASLSPRNKWERNIADASNLIKTYVTGGEDAATRCKVCTFNSGKYKAIRILKENPISCATVRGILKGPKLTEFYNCITGSLTDVCIDGHAYSVWLGDRVTLANVPKIGVKLRTQIKEDYRSAALHLGITPATIQAITWLAWRRLHGV
jgi:hypothetical protein